MRALIFALLCVLLAPLARADTPPLLAQVLSELGQHAAVRADFTQTRTDPALDKAQVSTGRLLFVLGHGMLWQTETPFAQTLALTGKRTAVIDADGRLQNIRSERGVSQVSQMLQGLLSGHVDDALRQFDVTVHGTPAAWTLDFVPRQERVARVLGKITLAGDSYLQAITIAMQDGSRTAIHFAHTRDAGPLSALEQRALNAP